MFRRRARFLLLVTAVALGTAALTIVSCRPHGRGIDAGFWFEPITFTSSALDTPLTTDDLRRIEATARAEIVQAFTGLPLTLSSRRDATYRVRVVQQLRDPAFRAHLEVAGASYGVTGFGGQGAVSFRFLASGALARAPAGLDRAGKLAAIGRGIGRTAVHELVHQILPRESIHRSGADTYEYDSASRDQQYFGVMRWGEARTLLEARFGTSASTGPVAGKSVN